MKVWWRCNNSDMNGLDMYENTYPKKCNKIKRRSITCSYIWVVDISKCVYWLGTHSVNVWWWYVLLFGSQTQMPNFCEMWNVKPRNICNNRGSTVHIFWCIDMLHLPANYGRPFDFVPFFGYFHTIDEYSCLKYFISF